MASIVNITKRFPLNATNIAVQLFGAVGGLTLYPSLALFANPIAICYTPMCVMTHTLMVHNNLKYVASEIKNPEYKYMNFRIRDGLMYLSRLKPELTAELSNKKNFFFSYQINNPCNATMSTFNINKYFNSDSSKIINRYHLNDKHKNILEDIMKVRQQRFRHILSGMVICSTLSILDTKIMHMMESSIASTSNMIANGYSGMLIGGIIGVVTLPSNNSSNHHNFQTNITKLSDIIDDKYISLYKFNKEHYWLYIDTLGNIRYNKTQPMTCRHLFYSKQLK